MLETLTEDSDWPIEEAADVEATCGSVLSPDKSSIDAKSLLH